MAPLPSGVPHKALGIPATRDDDRRRKGLTGKRLLKYMAGGCAIAEDQMPHGWRFARDEHGRPRWEGMRGHIPEGSSAPRSPCRTCTGAWPAASPELG